MYNIEECFQQCQTNSCQTAEVDGLYDQKNQNEVKCAEKRYEKHIDDTNTIHKGEDIINHFDSASNLQNTTKTKITANNNEITEKSLSILENRPENTALQESNKDDVHSRLYPNLQSVGNERYNLNVTASNGPSTVQKEYLLEMASEVAQVLTDDTDHSEAPTSFNLDLKCRNQFLSSCLEEQKQLVNDLHVQVSRYVSI